MSAVFCVIPKGSLHMSPAETGGLMNKVNIDLETVHQANAIVDKVKTLTINMGSSSAQWFIPFSNSLR